MDFVASSGLIDVVVVTLLPQPDGSATAFASKVWTGSLVWLRNIL